MTTLPAAPARAVRPERWTYSLTSSEGSTCTTIVTSSMWRPRAATSVATSTGKAPWRKPASTFVRSPCCLLPCRAAAPIPTSTSSWATRSAPSWVRVNIRVRPSRAPSWAVTARFAAGAIARTVWSMVFTAAVTGVVSWLMGSTRKVSTMSSTCPSSVAEKSIF